MREVPPLCDCQLAHHKKIRGLRTRLFPAFRHQSSHLRLRRSPSLPESPVLLPPARGVVGSFFRMRAWCAWSLVVGFRLKPSVVSISFYHFPHARIEVNRV